MASAGAWVCAKDGWRTEDWLAAWRDEPGKIGTWIGFSGHGCCTWGEGQTSAWSITGTVGNHGSQTVAGESRCSNTSGTHANPGNPSTTNGQYCWCKMTSPREGSWFFHYPGVSSSNCSEYCASNCVANIHNTQRVRKAFLK